MLRARTTAVVLSPSPWRSPLWARSPPAQRARTNGISATRVLSLEDLLLQQVNAIRHANGIRALSRSNALTRAAAYHSLRWRHSASSPTSRETALVRGARRALLPPASLVGFQLGENLATFGGAPPTAEAIVAAWMASPAHRAILLHAVFRDAGIGIVHHPQAGGVFGGQPTWVITLDVGRR